MFKKRIISVHSDFKTGILFKITLFIGIILLIIFLFFAIISIALENDTTGTLKELYLISQSKTPNTILAFSILFIAGSIIIYFFKYQFSKLSKIADDIEKSEEYKEIEK